MRRVIRQAGAMLTSYQLISSSFDEEQVKVLGQAGISFFNNSWSKGTPLPVGGYSVIPVGV